MAHNLNENGNRMFYTGQKPWHGLGTELDNPATAKEAIEAANLDYQVDLQKVYTENQKEIEGKFATVRVDTNEPLGIVGNLYKPVQNVESFDFFDSVVGEKFAMYHTAGALGKGERIWILAKLPEIIEVTKKDIVEKYLLLTNSHDGCSALKMFFTPVRVVCQNTLSAALSKTKDGISIRHTGNINSKIREAQRALGIAVTFYSDFENSIKEFSKNEIRDEQAEVYFTSLICGENDIDISSRKQNQIYDLMHLHNRPEYPEIKDTVWSAYNAVTRYVDHERSVKNNNASNKLKSIWLGSGAALKMKAFDTALALVSN